MKLDENSFARIVDGLHDGLYFVDRNRVIQFWNKAAEEITGFTATEVIARTCSDNILIHVDSHGNELCHGLCPLAATIADGMPREAEVYLHHKDGHRLPVSIRVSALTDPQGEIIGAVELFTDVSNYRANELKIKELEEMALLDRLTRLANRNYVEKELQSRFEEYKRFNIPIGILYIDIDHFKRFNDTYGHEVGDRVLKFIAETLIKNSRPYDLIGRWGGEEFVGIIRNINKVELRQIGERLRLLVASSYIPPRVSGLTVK